MTEAVGLSQSITTSSRSNLAFALACLPKYKRNDMIVLYAFCREVDNLADDVDVPMEKKVTGLGRWRDFVKDSCEPQNDFEREIAGLLVRYPRVRPQLLQVVRGMRQDLNPVVYRTWGELRKYCYMVASSVGLASLEIFGYRHKATRRYAVYLGYALQLTNIMRDIREDLENDRIYLPLNDLTDVGYSSQELRLQVYNDAFLKLMDVEWRRVCELHGRALGFLAAEDRANVISAELMGRIYEEILEKMRADQWRVFDKRYKLSKGRMLLVLSGHVLRTKLRLS